ncbi:MAG: host-nuclease inhibitor Gam family protein [Desulfovibrionaceae bacterium]
MGNGNRRIKPTAVIIGDLTQADGALAELAAFDRELSAIDQAMNQAIDAAKAEAKAKAEPLLARCKVLEAALATFGNLNKAELFGGARRSQELTFGVIGFRRSTRLKPKGRGAWKVILERIKELGLSAVRIKEEVDKDALAGWPDERLEAVGVVREQADEFYVELKREEVGA